MSMHMIRGIQVHGNSSKKKKKKTKGILAEEEKMAKLLKRVGYKGGGDYRAPIPSYSEDRPTVKTSDTIPGYSPKSKANQYTGDYIIGIGTMHKSNMVPITNKKDAEAISQMRRN